MLAALADPILPVFFVMAVGLFFGKTGVFSPDMARSLNAFVFYLGQPALIFLLATNAPFGDYDIPALALYLLSELFLHIGISYIAYRVFRREIREAILIGMTAIFVNHLYYVLPTMQLLHGPAATAPIEGAIFIDVAFLFCGTVILIDLLSRKSNSPGNIAIALATNPALLALVIGIIANFAGPNIPAGFLTFADFSGRSASPIILFALGVVISQTGILYQVSLIETWY